MKSEDAIAGIAARSDALKARGVAAAYLFGSTIRGEARPDSDLDLFIDVAPDRQLSLLDIVGIKLFLEDELGCDVDLTTRRSLNPMLRESIEREAIRVL